MKILPREAEKVLLDNFDIVGVASSLPGEIDCNFKINVNDKSLFILKISRPNDDDKRLDFQQKLLEHISINNDTITAPKVIKDKEKGNVSEYYDTSGNKRNVRLLSWISGRMWSNVNPKLNDLRFSLGKHCGLLTKTLFNFEHPQAHFSFEWDIAQSLWTNEYLHLFNDDEKKIVVSFQNIFENNHNKYDKLRKSIIHNDANDNNIIVSSELINPKVKALIDYGDAIYTQTINDLVVACAYGIMDYEDPLDAALSIIKGYHENFPLLEDELFYLHNAIGMRLVISVTKSEINKIKEPDNTYLLISEKRAWALLKKWHDINDEFAHYSFRAACGFTPHPKEKTLKEWMQQQNIRLSLLFPEVNRNEIHHLDLSVSSKWIGHQSEFNDLALFQFKIDRLQQKHADKIIAGGYLEPRPLYTSTAYDKTGNHGRESRSIHLGVDFWLPAQTPVHAFLDGEVAIAVNDAGDKEYGGLIILKHEQEDFTFYTLYGHLTIKSATNHNIGDHIKKGELIGHLGNYPENGNWAPHLHFQFMLSLLNYKNDFPGVAYQRQIDVWKSLCPDPNLLIKSKELQEKVPINNDDLITFRNKHLGKSLSLQYKTPIKIVRGAGQYLMDEFGRKYLDTINNVAHVGHEHASIVKAGQEQMAVLNTNTRYLHENINLLAKELLNTLPPELSVIHFVNSGSEANELAIRMVKANTDSKEIIASEVGYHGNSNTCINISSYKFDGKGGNGAPEHTHIFPLPDAFRGKYKGTDAGEKYAEEVKKLIENIYKKGRTVGAFIIEPIISCGGQIELPEGFLEKSYEIVRKAGGLCISDEVQTGCGRMGKTFWGFQLHNVVPDIVTIGKPLGNGHPIAAVACTQEIADKFANGMEYFNTFGGNPVSCAIGAEVLRTVKREKLQENAQVVGAFVKSELKKLSKQFRIIGEVRGQGLFIGIELVDSNLNPLPNHTEYLINRMKDYCILLSSDGPDHNVLKIKPPMVFTKENAEELVRYLSKILDEDFFKSIV